jgi:7-carboxy-7-deazaguanine synthase
MLIKEIFGPTIQGEGSHAGSVAVFIRTATCNMWDGREETKESSQCPYCDTDFRGGEDITPQAVFDKVIDSAMEANCLSFVVVLSGGEPLLQPADELITLINLLHKASIQVHIETNGTINSEALEFVDWIVCSPKLSVDKCRIDWKYVDDIKILYPHPNPRINPESFYIATKKPNFRAKNYYLQAVSCNYDAVIKKLYSLGKEWRLSVQTHKYIGVK